MQDNHHVANRLSTGLIKTDGPSNPPSQSVITYEYDANDRLTKSTLQGPPPFVAMAKTADDLYAESSSRRSHHGMKAFALAALGTLCVPVLLMRSRHRPLGRRARRRRIVNSAMLVFMALLMAVGPENVQAAYLNSALYQSLVAAGLAQVSETITTYQYDAAGNLTEERRGTGDSFNSYAYDAENHLRSATIRLDGDSQGFRFLSYTYDADGIRTSKTVKIGSGDPATTWYVVDKNRDYAQVLEERDANGTLAVRYVYGLDLIAQVRGPNPSYYHYDGLGSTRQLTNSPVDPLTDKPVVKNSYTYEAFGRRLESGTGDQVDNAYRFTGEQYDGQTSSYYLRARNYQPGTGRFTGRDGFEGSPFNPLSHHKYAYAHCSPSNGVDPSGHSFIGTVGNMAIRVTLAALRPSLLLPTFKAWTILVLTRAGIGLASTYGVYRLYVNHYLPPLIAQLNGLAADLSADSPGQSVLVARTADFIQGWYDNFLWTNASENIAMAQWGLLGTIAMLGYRAWSFFDLLNLAEDRIANTSRSLAKEKRSPVYITFSFSRSKTTAGLLSRSVDPAGDVRVFRSLLAFKRSGSLLGIGLAAIELGIRMNRYGNAHIQSVD